MENKLDTKKIFHSLPEDLQDAILSVRSGDEIETIGQKYKLHINQIAELSSETGNILLGISDPMDFVSNLSNKLGIEKNVAASIVTDINDRIFVKVKESLRSIHSGQRVSASPILEQKTPDLMKSVETETLNVPKKAMDILQGSVLEEKKRDTSIFGFQEEAPQKPIGEMNILEEKMRPGFSVKGEATEKEINQTIGKEVDPYKEMI